MTWRHSKSKTYETEQNAVCAAVCGALLGACLMYLLDPTAGSRRRSLIRGKMTRMAKRSGRALSKRADYSSGRVSGLWHEMRNRFRSEDVSDQVLCARVRSALGRAASHPRLIEVDAYDGTVELRGEVLANEVDSLTRTVRGVRGVRNVVDYLDVHDSAGQGVSSGTEEPDRGSLRF